MGTMGRKRPESMQYPPDNRRSAGDVGFGDVGGWERERGTTLHECQSDLRKKTIPIVNHQGIRIKIKKIELSAPAT